MNAERFCEILSEEGYPIECIKFLWEKRLLRIEPGEGTLRQTARYLKACTWLKGWVAGYEDRTGQPVTYLREKNTSADAQ